MAMRDIEKQDFDKSEYKVMNGKRVKVGRRHRRNNLTLYYYMIFFAVVITVTVLSVTLLFNANEVVVSGTQLYSSEQIRLICGVEQGDNLIRLDTHTAEKCALESLSYVDDIKVLRSFPSRISIKVTEAVPKANIEQDGKYYVVSESGRILEAGLDKPMGGLVVIVGYDLKNLGIGDKLESNDDMKQNITDTIFDTLEHTQLKEHISAINIADRSNIKLNYDSRINILLGSSLDLEYKLGAVKVIIDTKISDKFNGVIYYHTDSGGVSVIDSDKLSGSLKNEAPADYTVHQSGEEGDVPLQDKYNSGLK